MNLVANSNSFKSEDKQQENDQDVIIQSLQSSTRALIGSFRDRTEFLREHSQDIKTLLMEGYSLNIARTTAEKFFGRKKVSFIAIDGTESKDQELDMLLFYAGAFAYVGQIEFGENGCECGEVVEATDISNISAAIPLYEEDASNIVGEETEAGIEVDPERLPSLLMQFAEYYLAVKLLHQNSDIKVVILDRTLAGDVGHLIWSVSELVKDQRCVLQGLQTDSGIVSALDLELGRMLHPNAMLRIPAPRSQFIKYCALNLLISTQGDGVSSDPPSFQLLLDKIGANKDRLTKLVNDLTLFNKQYSFFQDNLQSNLLSIKSEVKQYWDRVFSAVMKVAQHIFDTPAGKHPLIYEQSLKPFDKVNGDKNLKKIKKWITSTDIEYMTLVMIYALVRLAWEKNILVIGLIKDTAASELIKTVVPLLRNAHKLSITDMPKFNSDKQLLQSYSVIEGESIKAPWRTFEFDACFRTMVPVASDNKDLELGSIRPEVKGAYRNIISGERMFVKSYIQLWQSDNNSSVRSHVFSYDRPCYPDFDKGDTLVFSNKDGNVHEEIQPMIHFQADAEMSHLVMDILCSMSKEVIPECLGHNYPLFLADKKAKYILDQMKTAYLSTIAFEMANSEFDQQVLFQARFRDYRSRIENSRRSKV